MTGKQPFERWMCVGLLFLIGSLFLIMMMHTPMHSDDYFDVFVYGTNHRINCLGDYVNNLKQHYLHVSSRVIPHLFIQTFVVVAGKTALT